MSKIMKLTGFLILFLTPINVSAVELINPQDYITQNGYDKSSVNSNGLTTYAKNESVELGTILKYSKLIAQTQSADWVYTYCMNFAKQIESEANVRYQKKTTVNSNGSAMVNGGYACDLIYTQGNKQFHQIVFGSYQETTKSLYQLILIQKK